MSLRPALAARSGRKLLSTAAAAVKPVEWESARPFEEIPGPKPIPILGNKHLFVTRFRKWNYYVQTIVQLAFLVSPWRKRRICNLLVFLVLQVAA